MSGRSLTALMIVAAAVALLSTSCDWKSVLGDIRGEIEGHKPVADAGGNLKAIVDTEVELDGSGSYDEDSDPLTYAWKVVGWPAGFTPTDVDKIKSAENRRAYFTPHGEGKFDISLTVSDSKFATEDVIQIEAVGDVASNLPPVAEAGPDQSGVANSSLHFDGSASSDPDSGDSIATWAWDFGDGASAATVTADHTYTAEGTYEVSLTVTDTNGATNMDTLTVTIYPENVNLPPTAAIIATNQTIENGVISGTSPLIVDFDGSSSSDPDTGDSIKTHSWSFGDGTSSALADPAAVTYSAGRYAVKLTVTDSNGASNTAAVTVIVAKSTSYQTTVTASEDITVIADPLQSYPAYNKSTNGIGGTLNLLKKVVPVVTLTRFNLSEIAGTVVTDATMTVTVVSLDGKPPRDTILAMEFTAPWSEKTTNFKSFPTKTQIYGKSLFSDIAKYQFDLTEIIAKCANSGITSLDIALVPSASYDAGFYIAGREYGKYPPIIDVTGTK